MPALRLPLSVPIATREVGVLGDYVTDTYLLNCYTETQQDGRKMVVKRPGLVSTFTYNGGAATNGQGTAFFRGNVYAMGSNVLYRVTGSGNGSASGSAWTASTAAPWKGRDRFGCVIFNGLIFVMGGENAAGFAFLNDVWSSPDGVNWTQVVSAAPWIARCEFGLVVLGPTMYLMGGRGNGQGFNDVWATQDGVNWVQVVGNAAWSARSGFGCVTFNQGIFVLGGNASGGLDVNDVWFSPDGVTWTQMVVAAAWSIRQRFNCIIYAGKIWILGGFNSAGGVNLQSVYSSPDGINWTNTGNLPAVRSEMNVCVYTNAIFMVGGSPGTTTVWSTTDGVTFTVVTAAYGGPTVQAGALIPLRTPTSISAINALTMWLIGGTGGVGFTNTIWRATLNVALPSSYSPATSATTTEQWDFTTQNAGDYLIAKNTVDAWVLHTGILQQITSTNYPVATVPGVINIDDTVYVMDKAGVIYGSDLSTPFNWSANNFITADYESDVGVKLVKYRNYGLALKSTTTQFFQDAGRYPGSPLLPSTTYNIRVGCITAASVVTMMDTVVWMARTNQYGPYIVVMDGTNPKKISTPSVDRLLRAWSVSAEDNATSLRVNGHNWYVLSLPSISLTLIYDFNEDLWFLAQSAGATAWLVCNYVTDGVLDYLQSIDHGILYSVGSAVYQDNGVAIDSIIQITKFDAGTNKRKFVTRGTVIGDRQDATGANNMAISWSDDDAQTFNAPQTVDLTSKRPKLDRLGSFFRRTNKFEHTSNNPMRVEAFELEIKGP